MCSGLGDLTPSSSPHNVGKDPRSLSLKRCPLQGLRLGEAGVFRLGLLSVYVLRAYDLDRWAAVPPLGLPTPCEKWGGLGLVIPFYATPRPGTDWGQGGRQDKQNRQPLCSPSLGVGGAICSREPRPCGPERYPSLCWLRGGQEPGSTGVPAHCGRPCVPPALGRQRLPAPPGHPTPSHSP